MSPKVCIVGGPAGEPIYRRVDSVTPDGTLRLVEPGVTLRFAWNGLLIDGPEAFRDARIATCARCGSGRIRGSLWIRRLPAWRESVRGCGSW